MEVIRTAAFGRAFKKLPAEIKDIFFQQEQRLSRNLRDPRLHLKRIRELPGVLSFRVTRRYRVFFYVQKQDKAILIDIDHRKDVYR